MYSDQTISLRLGLGLGLGDREISCKKSEISCESHWEENVSLADGNKWRLLHPRQLQNGQLTGMEPVKIPDICQKTKHLSSLNETIVPSSL